MTAILTPFAIAAPIMRGKGWNGTNPLPLKKKLPPPVGTTGHFGVDPDDPTVQRWIDTGFYDGYIPVGNIAWRLPATVVGLDVDNYDDKTGGATIAECEARWGALPPTYRITSRSDGTSGIRLYRGPDGLHYVGELPGGHVEVIQRVHRFVVAPPSVHPKTGATYALYGPDGEPLPITEFPRPEDLPALPDAWVEALAKGSAQQRTARKKMRGGRATSSAGGDLGEVQAWLDDLPGAGNDRCPAMAKVLDKALAPAEGSRYEHMNRSILRVVRTGEEGHPGVNAALADMLTGYIDAAVSDGADVCTGEFNRSLTGACEVVAADPTTTPTIGDPCVYVTTDPSLNGQAQTFEMDVQRKAHELRVLDEARAINARSKDQATALPEIVALEDFLAVEDDPVTFRVRGLLPIGGRVLLSAQYKAGKSTITGNLTKSLADGEAFLDEFAVTQPTGTIVLIDNELDERTLRRWMRDHGIKNPGKVRIISLRGQVGQFNILDPANRARWVEKLRAVDAGVVIFDCLRPVLDALGLSEDKDAGKFLVAFDALLYEARVGEAVVVHHMGHSGERSRGDSRLRDWPDAEWRLVRQADGDDPDPDAPRFFSAFGRDVNVPEGALTYEPVTRHLSYAVGNRKQAKAIQAAEGALPDVLKLLEESPLLSGNAIETALKATGRPQNAIRGAYKLGVAQQSILTQDGPRNSTLHYLNPSSSLVRHSSLPLRPTKSNEFVSSSIGDELNSTHCNGVEFVGNELNDVARPEKNDHRPRVVLTFCAAPDCAVPTLAGTDRCLAHQGAVR